MRLIFSIIFGLVVMFKVSTTSALPIVSVDMDPTTPGIQSSLIVDPGDIFLVDVVVTSVTSLQGFEFDLDFNSSSLSATSVVTGGFLVSAPFPFGFGTSVAESDITAPDVNFAEVVLGLTATTGSGTLATINFNAISPGTSSLDLNDVILSAPFGVPISLASVNDGNVTVTPEPATFLLLGLGLAGLVGYGSRRRLKERNALLREKGKT